MSFVNTFFTSKNGGYTISVDNVLRIQFAPDFCTSYDIWYLHTERIGSNWTEARDACREWYDVHGESIDNKNIHIMRLRRGIWLIQFEGQLTRFTPEEIFTRTDRLSHNWTANHIPASKKQRFDNGLVALHAETLMQSILNARHI